MIHKANFPCPTCQAPIEVVIETFPGTQADPPDFDADVPEACKNCGFEISDERATDYVARTWELV